MFILVVGVRDADNPFSFPCALAYVHTTRSTGAPVAIPSSWLLTVTVAAVSSTIDLLSCTKQ